MTASLPRLEARVTQLARRVTAVEQTGGGGGGGTGVAGFSIQNGDLILTYAGAAPNLRIEAGSLILEI